MLKVNNIENQILFDYDNKWKYNKINSLIISDSFERLFFKYNNDIFFNISQNIKFCSSYLEFKFFSDGNKKLHKAMFCRNRLCSMCNWRRSLKIFSHISKIINEINSYNIYDYIFLTLTCKNCFADDLNFTINKILNSFMNMIRCNKKIKLINKGYFRALEVTYNKDNNTYHPHIHCIIVVEKNYFHWRNKNYIKTNEWARIWQYYLNVDYLPIIDLRKIKFDSYRSISELSKYTVKSNDIILFNDDGSVNENLTDINIFILYFALKGRRLIGMGGLIKILHKKLNLDSLSDNDIDLINVNFNKNDNILNYIILKFKWNIGFTNYILIN